jgi:hypothetical protein
MIPRNVQITLVLLLILVLGSGIYILRLHRRTQENLRRASATHPVGPPISGATERVKLTVAYDDDGVFRSRDATLRLPSESGARAKEILETLITEYVDKPSPHPLAEGSAVNNVFLINQKLAVIDISQALVDGHRSGVMVEDFTLMSIIDTLATNFPQVEQVKIVVEGKERETLAGHADLMSIYSTAVIHSVVQQLQ